MPSIKQIGKGLLGGARRVIRQAVLATALPASGVANIGTKVLSGSKALFNTAKTFTTQKTINPLAGTSGFTNIVKKGLGIAGTGAAVGTLFQAARMTSKAAISGDAPDAGTVANSLTKGAITGGAIASSPIGGIIGAIEGTGKSAGSVASNFYNALRGRGQSRIEDATTAFRNFADTLPTSPKNYMPDINITMPGTDLSKIDGILPTAPQQFIFESPSTGFNPSFSLGSGGSDSLPLWLLAAGLGGGFLLGRKKKRRKKKYKKRKRK